MDILIVYASRRGVTRQMGEALKKKLEDHNHQVTMKKAAQIQMEEILQSPILIFGSSTWADGDLHEDFDKLERELRDQDLSGKKGAVFGSGNSRFRYYCEAVDILETRLKHSGANLLAASLKADVMEKKMTQAAEEWADSIIKALEN